MECSSSCCVCIQQTTSLEKKLRIDVRRNSTDVRKSGFEAIHLLSILEIEAATELLSTPNTSTKIGYTVPFIKAKNIKFLTENSKVPVPEVHIAFKNPTNNKTYIIMEYLPSNTLKNNIIKDIITKPQSILLLDYFRMLNHQPYLDRTLSSYYTMFTHSNLQLKNIIVQRLRDRDGYPDAGWYLEFRDLYNITITYRFKPN
ncbi:kinase-like protein [Aspergillus fumigatus]